MDSYAEQKQDLIVKLTRGRDEANKALTILRNKGWLADGTLAGADLSGAKLSGCDLSKADIRNAKFCDADMSEAKLELANLQDSDLSRTYLIGTDFTWANLTNVCFDSARLANALLLESKVIGASLRHSGLHNTKFIKTELYFSDFTEAHWDGAVLANVDLRTVTGLESATHRGPSTLGIDTLYRSKGSIPEIFLRGCGIPEEFIQYVNPLLGKPIQFFSCFISYSHNDQSFARRLHDTLQMRGIRCWLDEHQMLPGDDPHEEINRGIRLWDKILLCCSKASLDKSWWVDTEIERTFAKERDLQKERGSRVLALIPLNLDGYLFSSDYKGAKGDLIRGRIAADFTGWEHDNAIFEREVEKVIKALKTEGAKEPPPTPKL